MNLTPKSVSAILFIAVSLINAAAQAMANLPQNATIQYDLLGVGAAVVFAAAPLISDMHAQRAGLHVADALQEVAAIFAPAKVSPPDPTPIAVVAPIDSTPVTPVTAPDPVPVAPAAPVVDVAAVVAQLQAKRAEEDALLAQLTAGQSA